MPIKSTLSYLAAFLIIVIVCILLNQTIKVIGDPTLRTIEHTQIIYTRTAFFIDTTDKVKFDDLIAQPSLLKTAPLNDIPWSFDQQTYWLKLTLQNKSDKHNQLVAYFDNPMLDELTIYQVTHASDILKQKTLGDTIKQLNLADKSFPSFEFDVTPNDSTTLFLRIKTTGIAKTPILIYTTHEYQKFKEIVHLIWGGFIGICIMIALYNLVLFFGIKDPVYLIYIGYIISVLMLTGVVLGFGHYIWPSAIEYLLHQHVIFINFAIAIFSLLFTLSFLRYFKSRGRLFIIARYFLFCMLFFAGASLFIPEYIAAPIFFINMAMLYLISFILIGYKVRLGFRWAKFYVISWLPMILCAPIQPLMLTGKIEYSFLTSYAFLIGVLLEIILMAMALADKMRYQKEKALFNATHELTTNLPNLNLLETRLLELQQQDVKYSLCVIEITNLHSIAPYISNQEIDKLILNVVEDISAQINTDRRFIEFEKQQGHPIKVAKARDGVLAILACKFINLQALILQLEKIQHTINKDLTLSGLFINLDTHIGVCDHPHKNTLISHIISQAFQALAQGKREGIDICIFEESEELNVAQRLSLATELQQAIRDNKLELYHQPQINLSTNTIAGSEVLLRWQHPELGFISPDKFIRIAEDTGVINELTLWVIHNAFNQLNELIQQGFNAHKVSINISGKDINMRGFLNKISKALAGSGVPPELINLELTESVMVSDFKILSELMKAFANMGINVSVDDYGTGYSSLAYISQLPFNELKIDKSFVLNLAESPRNYTIVKNTIDMAKNLHLSVVAEGVESSIIEQKLRDCGCDIVQGYYYSKPLPFSEYLIWLKKYQQQSISQVY